MRVRLDLFDRMVAGAALLLGSVVILVAVTVPDCARAAECSDTCEEHGVCRDGRCWCEKGWVGEDCSTEGDNSCDMSCFGRGLCDSDKNRCECEEGWAGPFCGRAVKDGGKTDRSARAASRDGEGRRRRSKAAKAPPECPPELSKLPWWERYRAAANLDRDEVIERLRGCEARPEPAACVEALVKLGEVDAPKFTACQYGAAQAAPTP